MNGKTLTQADTLTSRQYLQRLLENLLIGRLVSLDLNVLKIEGVMRKTCINGGLREWTCEMYIHKPLQTYSGKYSSEERRNFMRIAIDTLSKFHIVLNMEWLAYGGQQVRSVLGFDDLTALTTRVRPHITQALRDDGQQKNTLGSASIKKASWVPSEYLDEEQYKKMSEDLALDEILTDVARRMFLERLVCKDLGGGVPV